MLCISNAHGRFVYPKLTCFGTPLLDKKQLSGQDLAMQLIHTDYYANIYRDANDTRIVQENVQKAILTLIMNRRLLITTKINNFINHNNLCTECAILKEGT